MTLAAAATLLTRNTAAPAPGQHASTAAGIVNTGTVDSHAAGQLITYVTAAG